jgi:predicted component of type VI protein secretion system
MAKLVLSKNGLILSQYFPDKDVFLIGRKAGCDVHIDDAGVSKEHARILSMGNDQVLEDMNSTNGTYVNGVRIIKHILQSGDVIEVHGYQLKYISQKAARELDFDKTMMISGVDFSAVAPEGRRMEEAAVAVPTTRATRTSFPLGRVTVLSGNEKGREVELSRVITLFGLAGKQLVVVTRRSGGYFISHVEGSTPAKLNSRTLPRDEPQPLADDDQIEVGGEKLLFRLSGSR